MYELWEYERVQLGAQITKPTIPDGIPAEARALIERLVDLQSSARSSSSLRKDSDSRLATCDFENIEETLSIFESLVETVRGTLGIQDPEAYKEITATVFLLKATMFYLRETVKCFGASAFFAANVLGAAGLESLLAVLCILRKADVTSCCRWRLINRKKPKAFLDTLGQVDLGTLLEIAMELGWFPTSGVPASFKTMMSTSFGEQTADKIVAMLPPVLNVTEIAAVATKQGRNWLHPARCLRQNTELSDALSVGTCIFLLLSISGLIDLAVMQQYPTLEALLGR